MPLMKVNEVRPPTDADFEDFKNFMLNTDGWREKQGKNGIKIYIKSAPDTPMNVIKVEVEFKDISAESVYDTIHDPVYRVDWDIAMKKGYEICRVSDNSDIGYYAINCPPPFKNRDYCTQRAWRAVGDEFIVFNHSVSHKSCQVDSSYVRAISFLTGYLVQRLSPTSCRLYYVTHNDPRGKVPPRVMNWATSTFIPKVLKRLQDAATGYPKWKEKHDPSFKPWLFPEQMDRTVPVLALGDLEANPHFADPVDETEDLKENEFLADN